MFEKDVFAKLISPTGVDDFFQNYFEKKFLHVCRKDVAEYYHHVLNINELDRYFQARNLTHDFLRVTQNGTDYHLDRWTKFEQRSCTDPYRIVVVENLFSLFNEGATIIINAAQTSIPGLTTFCSSLEHELKTRVQPNIYITPPNSQGFVPHFDPHDVFVIQISGRKQWLLYDHPEKLPVCDSSVAEFNYATKAPDYVVEMQAGDLLYMPRGTVHFAKSYDEPSIHITVGLMARYWFNLLKDLVEIAQEDVAFRRVLPLGVQSEEDLANFIEEFRQKLKDLIAKTDIQTLIDKNHAYFVERHLIDRQGHFTDLLNVEKISLETVVKRRAGIDYLIERNEKDINIKFGMEEISLPNYVSDSLAMFLQEETFAVKEIKGLITDSGKIALVKRFVQTGFLNIVSI
jgi:ribosomal protein L16 Arg81 hydroxylase